MTQELNGQPKYFLPRRRHQRSGSRKFFPVHDNAEFTVVTVITAVPRRNHGLHCFLILVPFFKYAKSWCIGVFVASTCNSGAGWSLEGRKYGRKTFLSHQIHFTSLPTQLCNCPTQVSAKGGHAAVELFLHICQWYWGCSKSHCFTLPSTLHQV